MDINQGAKESLQLIRKGLSARDLLVIATNFRRIQLEHELRNRVKGKIVDGPFKGCIHPGEAHSSSLCPKLLGTYEKEISRDLLDLAVGKDCFIDIGCAEGYYTTGIGVVTDIPLILGVDVNEKALECAQKSSELNGISGKTQFFPDLLAAVRLVKGKSLVMIDVDGSEIDVINRLFSSLNAVQALSVDLIIETDRGPDGKSNVEEIVDALRSRNFVVEKVVKQSVADRFSSLSEKLSASYLDLFIYGLEGRPLDQCWLVAKPVN